MFPGKLRKLVENNKNLRTLRPSHFFNVLIKGIECIANDALATAIAKTPLLLRKHRTVCTGNILITHHKINLCKQAYYLKVKCLQANATTTAHLDSGSHSLCPNRTFLKVLATPAFVLLGPIIHQNHCKHFATPNGIHIRSGDLNS